MLEVMFRQSVGLYALGFIGLLILLYLFSKRPKKMVYPSLMFFIRDKSMKKLRAFFRRLIVNWLFFLQLLVLALLGLAAASPFLEVPGLTGDEHIIIVIDSSGSMQAEYKGSTRFEEAKKDAISLAQGKKFVSIVLAEKIPLVLADRAEGETAIQVLKLLEAGEAASNIGDAMLQTLTLEDKGKVYVFSDFSYTEGTDFQAAKRQLVSNDYQVDFKEYFSGAKNIGFVDYEVEVDSIRLKIKNYQDDDLSFDVDGGVTKKVSVRKNGITDVSFPLKEGKNVFEILADDDLAFDNVAYVFVPEREKIQTLFITSQKEEGFLEAALESIGRANVTRAILPVVPQEDFELYIVKDVDPGKLLPATFDDLYRKAENGATVIVHMQDNSQIIDYKKLELVELGIIKENTKLVKFTDNSVTKDVEFGTADQYFGTVDHDCGQWVVSEDKDVLICNKEVGEGNVLFFGLLESSTSFKNRPDYPLFWNTFLEMSFPEEKEERVNFPTGEVLPIQFQKAVTPDGEVETNRLILSKSGFYEYGGRIITANLFDIFESDVNTQYDVLNAGKQKEILKETKERHDLTKWLLFIALLLLVIELIVIKWRGDI